MLVSLSATDEELLAIVRFIEIYIPRQFIEQGVEEDDDEMSQLSLTYRYEPTPGREALGEGNRWCNGVGQLAAFRSFDLSCASCVALTDSEASVVLDHCYAWQTHLDLAHQLPVVTCMAPMCLVIPAKAGIQGSRLRRSRGSTGYPPPRDDGAAR